MDPQGRNRQYLGDSADLQKQYEALVEQARRSPDGHFYLTTRQEGSITQIYISSPKHERYGDLPAVQLTRLTGSSFDPVWSPDGGRVAFVSQESGSEDVWVISADGSNPYNLTPKSKQTDRHPSWSADGSQVVFWSNRSGRKQLYVMSADGSNIRNISNTEWDEYDPVWIGAGATPGTAKADGASTAPSGSDNRRPAPDEHNSTPPSRG
jgi:Tol biopolymer transport system component